MLFTEQIIEAIKDGRLFDWIANNYHKLTKEELKRLALELEYARSQADAGGATNEILIEMLTDSFEFGDE